MNESGSFGGRSRIFAVVWCRYEGGVESQKLSTQFRTAAYSSSGLLALAIECLRFMESRVWVTRARNLLRPWGSIQTRTISIPVRSG